MPCNFNMDAYERCTNLGKKNLAASVAIYGRGRELFRPPSYLRQNFNQTFSSIRLNNTTTHEVDKIIHSPKCKDSYGYDEVSTRILKNSAPYILSPLTFIFNKILSTGIFPDRLKFSEVKPLFKKG